LGAYYLPRPDFHIIVGALLGVAFCVEILRANVKRIQAWFIRIVGIMLLAREIKGPTAATFFLLAAFLVSIFYSKDIAVLCLLFLIVGDTLAFFAGKRFGQKRFPNGKSLEGTLAFVISSLLVSLLIPGVSFLVKGTGIAIGAILEALDKPLDDNFILPLGSGLGMEMVFRLTN
jgi:dolichol kinase